MLLYEDEQAKIALHPAQVHLYLELKENKIVISSTETNIWDDSFYDEYIFPLEETKKVQELLLAESEEELGKILIARFCPTDEIPSHAHADRDNRTRFLNRMLGFFKENKIDWDEKNTTVYGEPFKKITETHYLRRSPMIYTSLTEKALKISFEAHKDQVDKAGIPYVYHPYEVARQMGDEISVCVALLHDVVEDTALTLEDLEKAGFPKEVTDAVKALTHESTVPYLEYVKALRGNETARKVKIADLHHNLDSTRLLSVPQGRREKEHLYKEALLILEKEDNSL